jgi:four helix bundle protein
MREFALRVIRLVAGLPHTDIARMIGKQLLGAGMSVGAHYREAFRAKSNADFVSKIEGALQELEETQYWLELLEVAAVFPKQRLDALHKEANELLAIFVTTAKNAKHK